MTLPLVLGVAVAIVILCLYRHQRLLKDRAFLMREAIRNQEFSFRLPLKGLFFGERALQEALNETGEDIGKLLARNEMESWQRLTRVLTHEIMNATTPISSISQAYLDNPAIAGTIYEEGIRAIHDTSRGLALFVESYRKLTELQEPVIEELGVAGFIDGVKALYPDLDWRVSVPGSVTMSVDGNMLRQVMMNLVKNAVEAGASRIDVRWNDGLWVSNDGSPIPADIGREIFVPFFTTKKGGSGIGLSLSRQMMVRQGRELRLAERSVPGCAVSFVIS